MRVSPLKVPSKVRVNYLEVLKDQERLNDIKKGRKEDFKGWKTLRGNVDVFSGKIERF